MINNAQWFFQVVERAFIFLTEYHGFTLTSETVEHPDHVWSYYEVRYENSYRQFVRISLVPDRLELDVHIGITRRFHKDYEADIGVFLGLVAPEYTHPLNFGFGEAPSSPKILEEHLSKIAEALATYGGRFFQCDAKLWEELETAREERKQQRVRQIEIEQTRKEAAEAFKNGDWGRVISLYNSLSEDLTPVEQKRMSIALKRSESNHNVS